MTRTWPVSWTVAAFMAVAVIGILLRPLLPIDETRYVSVAWEMYLSGDWFVPTKNGEIYTHKPPLLFWLINLAWMVTGVSEFAARLVAPLFAGATIVLTARLAGELWPGDRQTARRAAMVLAGMTIFGAFGGSTMFDTMLATATLVGLLGLFRALTRGGRVYWALYGFGIAFGIYAKGPVIFFHLIPALLLYPLWLERDRRPPLKSVLAGFGLALLVALVLVGLWLGPALIMGGPEYREAVLWKQSAGRVTNAFAHARAWWFYLAVLPAILFPWFWVPAVWRAALSARLEPGLKFCLSWALGSGLLFGLISAKQLHYLLPVLPAVALMIGRILPDEAGRARWPVAVVPVILTVIAVIAIDLGVGNVEDAQRFLSPSWAVWVWAALVIGLCVLAARLPVLVGNFALGLGIVLSLNVLLGISDPRETYDTSRIGAILAERQEEGIAMNQGGYHAEFNFTGRLRRPLDIITTEDAVRAWAKEHPRGVLVGQPRYSTIPWEPRKVLVFRNKDYGIWYVEDAPAGIAGDE